MEKRTEPFKEPLPLELLTPGIAIVLPWPPTVNHYYTIARNRKILSKRGRDYKRQCGIEMLVQKTPRSDIGPYAIFIRAYPPDKRRRDLDNILKPCLDSLTEYGAIGDDSMIDDLRIQRFNPVKDGRVELLVR